MRGDANCALGMDDVLPKPFTKEGLLQMLEKHLQHLKKSSETAGNDPMGPPASASSLSHRSGGQSLKDDSSPAASPSTMTSNWNSPAQFGGMTAPSSATFPPQMQGGPMGQGGFNPMGGPMNMGANGPLTGHRRHVSDMTGGSDDLSDPKRQRMYQQQQGGQMQGSQHIGNPMQSMSMGRGPNG